MQIFTRKTGSLNYASARKSLSKENRWIILSKREVEISRIAFYHVWSSKKSWTSFFSPDVVLYLINKMEKLHPEKTKRTTAVIGEIIQNVNVFLLFTEPQKKKEWNCIESIDFFHRPLWTCLCLLPFHPHENKTFTSMSQPTPPKINI